jgi:hypothetical protein
MASTADVDPFDHNGECRFCDELGYHRADCSWLLQLMREHAMWSAGSEELAKRIDELEAENKKLREWRDAIIDATVVDWIFTKEHETNPRKAVNDLLCWQQQLALNPAVSEAAAQLHARIDGLETENAQLRADYTEAVRLYRERDAQAARYHDRLQIDPGGSDAIDGLEAAVEMLREQAAAHAEDRTRLRADLATMREEKAQQFVALQEIRQLCDRATGIDRNKGDARESGALGAVRALVGRYQELVDVINKAD